MQKIYRECLACHGKGYVEIQDWKNVTTGGTPVERVPCQMCDDGYVETGAFIVRGGYGWCDA